MNKALSIYCAIIDFKMASDCGFFSLYKLLLYNLDGKMFKAIHIMYDESRSCIRLNDMYTCYLNVDFGVKQGDPYHYLCFSVYIYK